MSFVIRHRRVAYDNIAVGVAPSDEEHIAVGQDPPAQEFGQKENVAVGVDLGQIHDPVGEDVAEGERLG